MENSKDEEFKAPASLQPPKRSYKFLKKTERGAKSHIEFMKLAQDPSDPLRLGQRPLREYTMEEVEEHNTKNDA